MYWPNLKSVALPVSEIIAMEVFLLRLRTPNLGEGRLYAVDGTILKSVGEFR